MSEKRRGLGRGLGALIPNSAPPTRPAGDRPVDVFFPGGQQGDGEGRAERGPTPGAVSPDAMTATVADGALDTAVALRGEGADGTEPAAPVDGRRGVRPVGGESADRSPHADPSVDGVDPSVPRQAARDARRRSAREGDLVPVPGASFAEIPVDAISPNPRQPRQVFDEDAMAELVHSIREIGVLQPVVVRRADGEHEPARYELIMGERRWRASREAGLDVIPAIIRETSDDTLLRDALLENLHRSDLNALEEAAAYQQLLDDFGCTHEELATRIGRSRPQNSNTLRLLRLPPLVQRRVAAGVLSAGHARALLGLEDAAGMERLAQRIVAEGLSVRAVEEIVALGDGPAAKQAKRRPRPGSNTPELNDLASRLGDRLDTRVTVALGRSRGRLSIDFASVEDLNRIVGLLAPDVRKAFSSS